MEIRRRENHLSLCLDLLLCGIVAIHVVMAPYTKVEESFNVQAMHDILFHKHQIDKYDHLEFPGVVPRSFIGAMTISLLSSPLVFVGSFLNIPKLVSLVIVRLVLGATIIATLFVLKIQIRRRFGHQVANAYLILTLLQFHLPFYVTRPLPNVFALGIVNLAYASWIAGRPELALTFLVFAGVIFRCDVILLITPIGLSLLVRREISIQRAIRWCLGTFFLSVGLTILIDSIFWRRWLWPEFEVFWFNSVLNKSSEWGVSPVHWYFTSALPRSLLAAYPLCFLGLVLERRVSQFVIPVFAFILLYSKLPHKELRFILFAVPMLNLSAAVALTRVYNNKRKPFWALMFVGCIFMLMMSAVMVGILSAASYANYPGGEAAAILHAMDDSPSTMPKTVHIDVLPAMTGVSRFCEKDLPWSYSKEEDLSPHELAARNFTYLLSAHSSIMGYNCLKAVPGFSSIQLQISPFPFKLVKKPTVYIHGNIYQDGWPGCESST